ncbi:flagellar hook-basal body complex protein [Anaeromicrobium sediminis]|uniref:Uncharacterized protein n=1 Tax=Anaeromicrobium sediminis TaxID=1478221 RepID=A0A267MHK1_9FIRM|nr:flagellar hook-basal body complex protein [Anaeromicrobium sediminis]PAB58280.1 hypothetical protein CCE28_15910 [Anaeromicrobium sediminis]
MLRGLYAATTGMSINTKKLDVITNNIANMNTAGYKRDLVITESFPEVLISKQVDPREGFEEPSKGIEVTKVGSGYELKTDSGYFRTKYDNMNSHERTLKVAVNKDGYLSTFDMNSSGNINTNGGNLVIGNKGPIFVGQAPFEINENGQVLVDGNPVDNLVMPTPPGVIGTLNSGVKINKIATNFLQGNMQNTESDLDMAIDGDGFFQIQTPDGIRYTRDGSFKLNENKELVTQDGYPVLGEYGIIEIDAEKIGVNERGEILLDNEYWDTLKVVDLENKKDLRKLGNNTYKMEEGIEPIEKDFNGKVLQGFLEGSNVNSIKEMSKMISLYRNYETNQKIVKAYDETLGKTVNEIGKV